MLLHLPVRLGRLEQGLFLIFLDKCRGMSSSGWVKPAAVRCPQPGAPSCWGPATVHGLSENLSCFGTGCKGLWLDQASTKHPQEGALAHSSGQKASLSVGSLPPFLCVNVCLQSRNTTWCALLSILEPECGGNVIIDGSTGQGVPAAAGTLAAPSLWVLVPAIVSGKTVC